MVGGDDEEEDETRDDVPVERGGVADVGHQRVHRLLERDSREEDDEIDGVAPRDVRGRIRRGAEHEKAHPEEDVGDVQQVVPVIALDVHAKQQLAELLPEPRVLHARELQRGGVRRRSFILFRRLGRFLALARLFDRRRVRDVLQFHRVGAERLGRPRTYAPSPQLLLEEFRRSSHRLRGHLEQAEVLQETPVHEDVPERRSVLERHQLALLDVLAHLDVDEEALAVGGERRQVHGLEDFHLQEMFRQDHGSRVRVFGGDELVRHLVDGGLQELLDAESRHPSVGGPPRVARRVGVRGFVPLGKFPEEDDVQQRAEGLVDGVDVEDAPRAERGRHLTHAPRAAQVAGGLERQLALLGTQRGAVRPRIARSFSVIASAGRHRSLGTGEGASAAAPDESLLEWIYARSNVRVGVSCRASPESLNLRPIYHRATVARRIFFLICGRRIFLVCVTSHLFFCGSTGEQNRPSEVRSGVCALSKIPQAGVMIFAISEWDCL